MHYRNTITGADIYVNSEISAPNYVRIDDGAEALPSKKELPKEDPVKEDPEPKKGEPKVPETAKRPVTKKTTPKKNTKRAKK